MEQKKKDKKDVQHDDSTRIHHEITISLVNIPHLKIKKKRKKLFLKWKLDAMGKSAVPRTRRHGFATER